MDTQTIIVIGMVATVMAVLVILMTRAPKEALKDWGGRLITLLATAIGMIVGYYFQEPRVEQAQDRAVQAQMVADSAVTLIRDAGSRAVTTNNQLMIRPQDAARLRAFVAERPSIRR
jgi:flagellar motor component MotA